jgi:propanediol dehydratase small subunit
MPNLVRGNQTVQKVITKEVVTKEGEVKLDITLHLDITINAGEVKISASTLKEQAKDADDIQWTIPDFGSTERIQFGKLGEE